MRVEISHCTELETAARGVRQAQVDVCPVKVNLHEQLLLWRGELGRQGLVPLGKRVGSKLAGWVLARSWAYRLVGAVMRWMLPRLPQRLTRATAWGSQRELPEAPRETFREQYRRRRAK